jgi:hypothetical protein
VNATAVRRRCRRQAGLRMPANAPSLLENPYSGLPSDPPGQRTAGPRAEPLFRPPPASWLSIMPVQTRNLPRPRRPGALPGTRPQHWRNFCPKPMSVNVIPSKCASSYVMDRSAGDVRNRSFSDGPGPIRLRAGMVGPSESLPGRSSHMRWTTRILNRSSSLSEARKRLPRRGVENESSVSQRRLQQTKVVVR